eukprot:1179656-Prorocentrum_minimum.AAC.1
MFDCCAPIGVDPRAVALRILDSVSRPSSASSLDQTTPPLPSQPPNPPQPQPPPPPPLIRTTLANEWAEDLKQITEENGELLKESLLGALMLSVDEGEAGGDSPGIGGSMDEGVSSKLQAEWKEREKRIRDGPKAVVEEDKADSKADGIVKADSETDTEKEKEDTKGKADEDAKADEEK